MLVVAAPNGSAQTAPRTDGGAGPSTAPATPSRPPARLLDAVIYLAPQATPATPPVKRLDAVIFLARQATTTRPPARLVDAVIHTDSGIAEAQEAVTAAARQLDAALSSAQQEATAAIRRVDAVIFSDSGIAPGAHQAATIAIEQLDGLRGLAGPG